MKIDRINCSTLIQLIDDYIGNEYDYEYADVFDDEIVVHTFDGKRIDIKLNITIEEEED
jgi:hypothetical protein